MSCQEARAHRRESHRAGDMGEGVPRRIAPPIRLRPSRSCSDGRPARCACGRGYGGAGWRVVEWEDVTLKEARELVGD